MVVSLTLSLALIGQTSDGLRAGEVGMRLEIAQRGTVMVKLHTRQAPRTTARIQELVRQKFYDGQKFFRVEKDPRSFLVQIGDPASRTKPLDDPSMGEGGSGVTIPFEDSGFQNVEGAVGLATRANDPNSGDSQFYLLLSPARFLDGKYTVFGQVVSGQSVLEKIERGDVLARASLVQRP